MSLHKHSGSVLLASHGNLGASQMWELLPGWAGVCCVCVPTTGSLPRLTGAQPASPQHPELPGKSLSPLAFTTSLKFPVLGQGVWQRKC